MENLQEYKQTHLIESARINLACDYLVHEFRKIFCSITYQEAYDVIKHLAPNSKSDDRTIRDFWNLFCSLSAGWRLKELHNIVTAENIVWEKKEISIQFLEPGTPQGWMEEVKKEEQLPIYKTYFTKADDYLQNNKEKLSEWIKNTEEKRGNRAEGDEDDPIIVIKKNDIFKVEDGNSRLKRKIENWVNEGKVTSPPMITAWVGAPKGKPKNYWIPTSSLMFLKHVYPKKKCCPNIESVLKEVSPLALLEYQKRVKQNCEVHSA